MRGERGETERKAHPNPIQRNEERRIAPCHKYARATRMKLYSEDEECGCERERERDEGVEG